jgi:hypothetical protein
LLQKVYFYVMMTTEMFINYFCNIKLCCLWKFDGNMSVIYWEIICANILFYIYCFRVWQLYTGQQTNLFKINIFWFSSITRLKQDLTRRVWYSNFLHFRWHCSFLTWRVYYLIVLVLLGEGLVLIVWLNWTRKC